MYILFVPIMYIFHDNIFLVCVRGSFSGSHVVRYEILAVVALHDQHMINRTRRGKVRIADILAGQWNNNRTTGRNFRFNIIYRRIINNLDD